MTIEISVVGFYKIFYPYRLLEFTVQIFFCNLLRFMEEFLIINRFEEYCYSREMMGRIEEVLKRWIQFYSPSTLITVCS